MSTRCSKVFRFPRVVLLPLLALQLSGVAFADENQALAFPGKFMIRLASYSVQDADTQIAVANSNSGPGVAQVSATTAAGRAGSPIPTAGC